MAFRNTAAELTRQYQQNRNDIDSIYEMCTSTNRQVIETNTKLDTLATMVDDRFARVDERFDRLEQLLSPLTQELAAPMPPDNLLPQQEQRLRLLESKMNLYSRTTREHMKKLERHDERFDGLEGQMAEVLTILRDKST